MLWMAVRHQLQEGEDNEAFTVPGFEYIFLYPSHFTNPISPIGPAGKSCLKVVENAFVRDGKEEHLILAQIYTF